MKYEFHVGDYVETKDGWIGYVYRVDSTDNSLDIVWTHLIAMNFGIICGSYLSGVMYTLAKNKRQMILNAYGNKN